MTDDDLQPDDPTQPIDHPPEPTAILDALDGDDADTDDALDGDTDDAPTTTAGHDGDGSDETDHGDESAETRPSGPGPLVWLASALLVIALIAGVSWFAVVTARANREKAIKETATAYFTAIAAADADAAVALLDEEPANRQLITGDVLRASAEAAPLTDITLGEIDGDDPTVTVGVTYALGGQLVETALTLTGGGTSWLVADGTTDLTVPAIDALTINGATLTETTSPVLPGTYTAAGVADTIAISGGPTAVIAAPGGDAVTLDVTPTLSEAGTQAVLNTVKTRFEECLAATESLPANCPFGVSTDGVEVADGSVRFALVNDPWAGFAPTLSAATMTAEGTIPFEVNATATVTRDKLTAEASAVLKADRGFTVDLTADPMTVTWR